MSFPVAPVDGQTHTVGNTKFIWHNVPGAWQVYSNNKMFDAGIVGQTAVVNQQIENISVVVSSDGFLFINDTGADVSPTDVTSAGLLALGLTTSASSEAIEDKLTNLLEATVGEIAAKPADGYLVVDVSDPLVAGSSFRKVSADDLLPIGYKLNGPNISPVSLDIVFNTAFAQAMSVANHAAFWEWSITAGALPSGLTIDPVSGIVSGTADTDESWNCTIRATEIATGDFVEDTFSGEVVDTYNGNAVVSSFASPALNGTGIAYANGSIYSIDSVTGLLYQHSAGFSASVSATSAMSGGLSNLAFDGTNFVSSHNGSKILFTHFGTTGDVVFGTQIVSNIPGPLGIAMADGNLLTVDNTGELRINDGMSIAVLSSFNIANSPVCITFDGKNLISFTDTDDMINIHDGISAVITNSYPAPEGHIIDMHFDRQSGNLLLMGNTAATTIYVL